MPAQEHTGVLTRITWRKAQVLRSLPGPPNFGSMRWLAITLVALVGAVALACGGDGAAPLPAGPASPPAAASVSPAGGSNTPGSSGDFQQQILADGKVTFDEYERAVLAMVACAKEAGFAPQEEPKPDRRGVYYLSFAQDLAGADEARREEASNAIRQCYRTYFTTVQDAFRRQVAPSESELQRARNDLGACLRDNGIAAPERPSSADWSAYMRPGASSAGDIAAFRGCLAAVQDTYALGPGTLP